LRADPALAARAVQVLLDEHFAPSLQADLRAAIGLEDLAEAYGMPSTLPRSMADQVAESPAVTTEFVASRRRKRDASFRAQVLAAYNQRCAVSGFQALLGGTLFCLEAAHVHWHSHGGPSTVANGLALTPTLHKLFDHGAWSLDDNRRVIVSRHFSGSDVALGELRALEGRPLRAPAPGYAPLDLECIRWHREPELGGVFRT
jgi:putative restriction endonuclease